MMEQTNLVPRRRFREFQDTDAWEQCELGEVTEVYDGTHQTPEYKDEGIMFLSVENIKTLQSDKYISEEAFESEFKVRPETGDVLMTRIGDVGTANVVTSNEPIAYYVSLALLKKKDLNPYFLQANIHSSAVQDAIWKRTLHIAFPKKINKNEIEKVPISFPSEQEQDKIGLFFKELDNLITLHQRKLDKTKALKSAYLSEMFPAEGESEPKRRFAGFTQAWEQREFFDNIKYTIDFRGRTPRKLGLDWSETGYLALSALNVKNGYIDPSADAHYGNQELYDKWMTGRELRKGQVLFTTEAPMGNVAQVPDNKGYILSQRTIAFDVNTDKITSDFLAVLLRSPNTFAELSALSSGGTAKGVSQKSLSQLKVTVPSNLEEQTKIGTFLKNLDNLITLHQRKLEKLQNIKKAYLNEMFV